MEKTKINNKNTYHEKYLPTKISDLICDQHVITCFTQWLNKFEMNRKKCLSDKKINNIMDKKKQKEKILEHCNDSNDGCNDGCNDDDYDYDSECCTDKQDANKKNVSNKRKIDTIKKNLMLTGNHGIGKTSIAHVILSSLGYTIRTVNLNDVKNNKNIDTIIKSLICQSDILHIISKTDFQDRYEKIVILIDELESISSSVEKNCINTIISINNENFVCPVVLISNNKHNKFISAIKKDSFEIRINDPDYNSMLKLLKKICYYKKIRIQNEQVAQNIILFSQFDMRKLRIVLEDLNDDYNNMVITDNIFKQYINHSCEKNGDVDLFTSTRFLLTQYEGIDKCIRLYESEKVLIPLAIHQNYVKLLLECAGPKADEIINNISDMFSTGDVIENYIYGEQNWDLQEIHGYYTCVVPSFILNNSDLHKRYVKLDFSKDLNRTSIKNINKKNIINASKCFEKMDVMDYIYINKILTYLISIGQIETFIDMVRGYQVNIEYIKSIMKIDKIKSHKIQLTAKQKKDIKTMLCKTK